VSKASPGAGSGPAASAPIDGLAPVDSLRGIGPKRAALLGEEGVWRVRDLLFHLPRRYESRRLESDIARAGEPGTYTLRGKLRGIKKAFGRRRGFRIVRAELYDDGGSLPVVWYNQPYIAEQLDGECEYVLHGSVRTSKAGRSELVNPSWQRVQGYTDGILPVYPPLAGLGQARLRKLLAELAASEHMHEWLPDLVPPDLLEKWSLPELPRAFRDLHLPPDDVDVEALDAGRSEGHGRLIYGELLRLRTRVELARRKTLQTPKSHRYRLDDSVRERLEQITPFALTGAQQRAVAEILRDLGSELPMQRLLQGDVGCGKTIIAVLALVAAVESGLQGALMAPTEILAEQHASRLQRTLGDRYRIELFTGSRAKDLSALSHGEVDIAIGTHALIQDAVRFRNLGLAVIDEQHRFGVAQRQRLVAKGSRPDLLVMTATPIPRSLALTTYGDLDLSVIDEAPPGRGEVTTRLLQRVRRHAVYRSLRSRVREGDQAFVVLPFIEVSESLEASAIEREGREILSWLEGCRTEVVHGRLPVEERSAIMRRFEEGEIDVLVATPVIEVGVDVARACFMIIESAERFGLAQLHQLRGRVGRGDRESFCIALYGEATPEAQERLAIFAGSNDGFLLAEADLEMRGPGEMQGARQSGWPRLRAARLPRDLMWLERARDDARGLLAAPERPGVERFLASLERRLGEQDARGVTGG
jgi:ATP-dependent DNA helicase RecG